MMRIANSSVRGGVIRALWFCALLAASDVAAAMEVSGVKLEDTQQVGSELLHLNGAGLRYEFMVVDVYVAALYTAEKTHDPAAIIAAQAPRRLLMIMKRDVNADRMLKAFHKGIDANVSGTELKEVQPGLDRLDAVMRQIGEVKEGDVLAIDFGADGTVAIALDGKPQATIEAPELAAALLKIWLGPHPAQDDLKQELLGD